VEWQRILSTPVFGHLRAGVQASLFKTALLIGLRLREMLWNAERGGPARAAACDDVGPSPLRHGCGYALANAGHDTRALQAWLGNSLFSIR
jgi:integrase